MTTWLLVGVGGAAGAMLRHALNHVVHRGALTTTFPVGIFLVNVFGSFAIGLLARALVAHRFYLLGLSLLAVWAGFRLAQ